MAERCALWVSTSTRTRGGVASYVRAMQRTSLWDGWTIRHITTHRDGSVVGKVVSFLRGALIFLADVYIRRPDVIHLHASIRGSFVRKALLLWISRPSGVPVVLHMHGSGFPDWYAGSPRLARTWIRSTLDRADAFVTLSQKWAEQVQMIAPGARIRAIPNGIELAKQSTAPAQDEPVRVLFLGRIGDRKGTFRLLDAWAKLTCEPDFVTAQGSAAHLTVAGDGEVERARTQRRHLGLQDSVTVSDWLSEREAAVLLDDSQILVLPSRSEGQPMAVLEAMARGLCVVATDVDGLPEMIGGGCGVLIPPDDTEAIVAALRSVVFDADLRQQCGTSARTRVRDQLDVSIIACSIDALYREVCS
ncbi:glycosyl transferase [Mycobacterium sp. SWH-M1]|nr:glycosyl transferase [Mycobacterium sp. SWH-M1]